MGSKLSMTEGQVELERILLEYKSSFLSLWEDMGMTWTSTSTFESLISDINSNQIIRTDSLTARTLSRFDISKNYIRWVENCSKSTKVEETKVPISLSGFHYEYFNDWEEPCYTGGHKSDVVFTAMLSILCGMHIPSYDWSLSHFPNIGYTKIWGGGNHRSLAYYLLGNNNPNPDLIYIFDDKNIDKELNNQLLAVEQNIFNNFHFKGSKEDIENIKKIDLKSLHQYEINALKKYINPKFNQLLTLDSILQSYELLLEAIEVRKSTLKKWFRPRDRYNRVNMMLEELEHSYKSTFE